MGSACGGTAQPVEEPMSSSGSNASAAMVPEPAPAVAAAPAAEAASPELHQSGGFMDDLDVAEVDEDAEGEEYEGEPDEDDEALAWKHDDEIVVQKKDGNKQEFMAVKPWLGQLHAPSGKEDTPLKPATAPDVGLELEYVYGYRAHDTRQNVFYNTEGKVVSFVAALGLVLDVDSNTQQFFHGHDDDITCAAMHPDGFTVATGQMGKHPDIHVWDSITMEPKKKLSGHKRGVITLNFSLSGNTIGSVGRDDQQTIFLWDWKSGKATGEGKCGSKDVTHLSFQGSSEDKPLVCGIKHCNFINKSVRDGSLRARRGIFNKAKLQTCYVSCSHQGCSLTGTTSGDVFVWKGNQVGKVLKKVTPGALSAITSRGDLVACGGFNGTVVVLDGKTLKELHSHPVGERVRSVHFKGDGSTKILVGTQAACVLELDFVSGSTTIFLEGHGGMRQKGNQYAGELWGGAQSPVDTHVFATAGDDSTVRLWDTDQRKMLQCVTLPEGHGPSHGAQGGQGGGYRARTVSWKADGTLLAVGTLEGDTLIFDAASLSKGPLHTLKPVKKSRAVEVSAAKWSPDEEMLAIASHTGNVEVYSAGTAEKAPSHIGSLSGHTSAVIHFDWNETSEYIQSMSNGYELLFWDAQGGQCQITASALNDEKWDKFSLTLGWPVQGVYEAEWDGTDVNAIAVSPDQEVLARGDDFGKVSLLRWPCLAKGSAANQGHGHSSHVTNVQWLSDTRLMSCGGHDLCLFQWKVMATDEVAVSAAVNSGGQSGSAARRG